MYKQLILTAILLCSFCQTLRATEPPAAPRVAITVQPRKPQPDHQPDPLRKLAVDEAENRRRGRIVIAVTIALGVFIAVTTAVALNVHGVEHHQPSGIHY